MYSRTDTILDRDGVGFGDILAIQGLPELRNACR
jgi:hypothetical protein